MTHADVCCVTGPAGSTQGVHSILRCQSAAEENHPEEEGGRTLIYIFTASLAKFNLRVSGFSFIMSNATMMNGEFNIPFNAPPPPAKAYHG